MTERQRGFGIIETVIASAIIGGSLWALASVFLLAGSAVALAGERTEAAFLLEEGVEAVRHLRDAGWDANIAPLTPGQDYYFSFNASSSLWSIGTIPEPPIEGIFSRSVRVERVSRDANFDIEAAYNPANEDPETRKIAVKVRWERKGSAKTAALEAYLTDIFDN